MLNRFVKPNLWGRLLLMLLTGLILAGCCPPNCPVTPTVVQQWDDAIQQGDYAQVLEEATKIIEQGPEAEFYAEANLYAGVAEVKREGDLDLALSYLDTAEALSDQLTTIDPTYELTLLYRGKMVIFAKFGDIETATKYLELAVELSPELEAEIRQEFEDALQQP